MFSMLPYCKYAVMKAPAKRTIVRTMPTMPSHMAVLALELMVSQPPFDKRAKIIARMPETIEEYKHVQPTIDRKLRMMAAVSNARLCLSVESY